MMRGFIKFYMLILMTVQAHQLIDVVNNTPTRQSLIPEPLFEGPVAAAIIFFGVSLSTPEQYKEHFMGVQNVTHIPLWVSINTLDYEPSDVEFGDFVLDAIKEFDRNATKTVQKFFFGGHALSGNHMAYWIKRYGSSYAEGAFGLGAYAGYDQRNLGDMPVPFLTLGASLDGGQARITRMAQAYDKFDQAQKTDKHQLLKNPVFVISWANLSSFMSGDPPAHMKKTDIRAYLS